MDIETVKFHAKLKAIDIYKESMDSVSLFIDRRGYLQHPHLNRDVLNCIVDDITQAYQDVCDSDSRTLVRALKEMLSVIDLHTAAFTIIRSYT